jgi:hypothetical protein
MFKLIKLDDLRHESDGKEQSKPILRRISDNQLFSRTVIETERLTAVQIRDIYLSFTQFKLYIHYNLVNNNKIIVHLKNR